MKKLVILLVILLVGVLVITGCGPAATTTAKPPPVTTTAAPPVTTTAKPPVTTTAAPPVTTTAKPPVTTTAAPPVTTTAKPPVTTTAAPPATALKVTWEEALLPANLKKEATVTGTCVEISPNWSTHLTISLGKGGGEGFDAELYDPTLPGWPGVTGTDMAAFQAAWVGKKMEITGKIQLNNFTGVLVLNIMDPSQVKIVP